MALPFVLSLGALVGYGVADFLGGVYARRVGIMTVMVVGQAAGAIVLVVAIAPLGHSGPSAAALAWGAAAGAGFTFGGFSLLYGFRVAKLSVVSPLSSLGAAGIPIVADALGGSRLSGPTIVGLVLGLLAIWLVGVGKDEPSVEHAAPILGSAFGVGAGIGFAAGYLLLARTGDDEGAWPVAASQATTVLIAGAACIVTHSRLQVRAKDLGGVVAVGVATAAGTLCFMLAARAGLVSAAALLASLSPGVTVLLARTVLHESITTLQAVGLGTGVAALVAIGVG